MFLRTRCLLAAAMGRRPALNLREHTGKYTIRLTVFQIIPSVNWGVGEMTVSGDLHVRGQNAVVALRCRYQRGAYRVIRDPEGVISLWAIEGTRYSPFSIEFADRGRVSRTLGSMSPDFIQAFLEYVARLKS